MGKVFRKHGADNERIWVLLAVLVAALLTAAVWLYSLSPSAMRWVILALLIAEAVAMWKTRKSLSWFPSLSLLISQCVWLPFPWSGAAATLLLAALIALSRAQIVDALLPVRAYFIRRKANKK